MAFLWYVFELVGTIAFAVSGALVGISKKMDIFGISVLALATAIGGGIIRDMMVGNVPPNSLRSPLYVVLTVIVVLMIFILYKNSHLRVNAIRKFRKLYLTADALGLASFTVTGSAMGQQLYPENWILAITLGLVTAVGGGIIRDLLAQRIPSVLREEVYALPSIIGGAIYFLLANSSAGFSDLASGISFIIVFIIRMFAVRYHWSLPKVHG